MIKLVVAIDGPAASGKSTTARLTAEKLGYLYVDTGAMYRAMTLKVLQNKINIDDVEKIASLADETTIELRKKDDGLLVFLDNQDVTKAIRSQNVTKAVSAVSSIEKVRKTMVREQRRMGEKGGVVLEGRDIGTVVFPNADIKVFMVANVEERAKRRLKELKEQGVDVPIEQLIQEIVDRDNKDSKRSVSPLRRADGALILDTSNMTIREQVDFIVQRAEKILKRK